MKKTVLTLLPALLLVCSSNAATRYVDIHNTTPVSPYISWVTAATNIQDALDATISGDTVLVSNGVYDTGGRVVSGSLLTNRVVITNAVIVQSVNGPAVTTIAGAEGVSFTNDDTSVRAVWLGSGCSLSGFTVSDGSTRGAGADTETRGGGIWSEDETTVVSNCVISGNLARSGGAGMYRGTVYNSFFYTNDCRSNFGLGGGVDLGSAYDCVFEGNEGSDGGAVSRSVVYGSRLEGNISTFGGGGAYQSGVSESTIISNTGLNGGGVRESSLTNCVVRNNSSQLGGGLYDSAAYNCTIVSNSAETGGGMHSSDAFNSIVYFNASDFAGSENYFGGTLSYSCTTPGPGSGVGNITANPMFVDKDTYDLHLAAGSMCINRGLNSAAQSPGDLDGNPRIAFLRVDMGAYEYQTVEPSGTVHYVREGFTGYAFPYTSWETAAPDIQMAVDAAGAGSTVLVTNGVYDAGGRIAPGGVIANRVVIDKEVHVESVSGPANTILTGSGPLGLSAVRCVWMTNGASLSGFTVTGGHTSSNQFAEGRNGGGIFAQVTNSIVISNCFFTANKAFKDGGGIYGAKVLNSSFNLNHAEEGGGAYASEIWNSTLTDNTADYGAGARKSDLFHCLVYTNVASVLGGGLSDGYAENCLILENHSEFFGGGIHVGIVVNCTIVGNSAATDYGGSYLSNHRNTILYHNTSPGSPNHADSSSFINTCTYPLPSSAVNCFTNDPLLVTLQNPDLTAASPCRDTGDGGLITQATDQLGNTRVVNGYVDIGAREFQGAGQADLDGDGIGNGDEGVAGTDFTDSNDFFRVSSLSTMAPASITFDSVNGRLYAVDTCDDLPADPQVWTELTNNIPGTGGPIVISDTDSTPHRNFRVRVSQP